tara:strand:- start:947 stop:1120 length:174 start_codon:yes stop_codon:yes gene_type:complete
VAAVEQAQPRRVLVAAESVAQDLREQRAALVPLGQVAVVAGAPQTLAAMVVPADREP